MTTRGAFFAIVAVMISGCLLLSWDNFKQCQKDGRDWLSCASMLLNPNRLAETFAVPPIEKDACVYGACPQAK